MQKNYSAWVAFQAPKNRTSKNITTYANELLEGELKALYNLVYDYAGNRTFITSLKTDLTQKIKSNHSSNVKEQLRNELISAYNAFRTSGAMRTSDKRVLAGIGQYKPTTIREQVACAK